MTGGRAQLVSVQLVDVPLDLYARVQEAHEGLMREFALIALSEPGQSVSAQLVALTRDLQDRYTQFAAAAGEQRSAAMARGEASLDLVFEVPADIADAAAEFDALLDEAVEYCRHGDLLTLAPSDEHLAFRRWFLGEFVTQIRGGAPTPWSQYRARAS